MFRNPINAFPYNVSIDATKTNTFHFNFSGDKLKACRVKIMEVTIFNSQDTPSSDPIYVETIVLPTIKYNGDKVELTIAPSASYPNYTNNKAYYWTVDMWATDNTTGSPWTSVGYYFTAYADPTMLTSINGTAVQDNLFNLASRNASFVVTYAQTQNIPVKYFWFKIKDSYGNTIAETDKIFSSNIIYSYNGFVNGQTYEVEIKIETQKNQIISQTITVNTNYTINLNLYYPPIITCDSKKTANVIKWIKDKIANGIASGNYSITGSEVTITSGDIVYDNANGVDITMDSLNFGLSFKVTVSKQRALNGTKEIVAKFTTGTDDSDVTIEIYCYNGTLWVECRSLNWMYRKSLYEFYATEAFPIQDSNQVDETKLYQWSSNTADTWFNSASQYWLVNSNDGNYIPLIVKININNGAGYEDITATAVGG